jgi:2-polyprenyl-6-methoxyphenol hydroxylase-like FAD-dependent oxidoreductase
MDVLIVGAGIGGLTLALSLHRAGIPCRVFEATHEIRPLGVGINLLPHAMRELVDLGLETEIAACGIETREVSFFNRFGQHIFTEPRGRFAGYDWPQYSIHRGDLQAILIEAVRYRLGPDALLTGHRLMDAEQSATGVVANFQDTRTGHARPPIEGEVLVGCDGIRSTLRARLHPEDGPMVYSGITMWRGITRWKPFLSGATMAYAGWLETGKVIFYPVREAVGPDGLQDINWLCEFYTPPRDPSGDWSQPGDISDFLWACQDMRFDWLDVPAFVKAADFILEYPMVDKDPLERWSFGRMTLLGDAAHPMYPRGSNGAGQAILDARSLTGYLARVDDLVAALKAYESDRLDATSAVVRANRAIPPDAILREVYERTGDKPFQTIDAVIGNDELQALSDRYKQVAGFQRETLRDRAALA